MLLYFDLYGIPYTKLCTRPLFGLFFFQLDFVVKTPLSDVCMSKQTKYLQHDVSQQRVIQKI